MSTAPAPNSRASLLAGLRTGGVRSASIPHTAAPGGTFNLPRFASHNHSSVFPDEEGDQVLELPPNHALGNKHIPMTAAVDGPNARFSQQQHHYRGMNPNSVPFSPGFAPNILGTPNQAQAQAFQLQLMQLELIKLQAMQAQQQQYQAEMLAQAQFQQQQQQPQNKRLNLAHPVPASAGPLSNSFDLRTAALSAQMRRANHAEQLRSQTGGDHVPMTAALGGKFGSRSVSATNPPSRFASGDADDLLPPATPNSTTVISGGTSLGSPASNNLNTPSKSDAVASWRRGGGKPANSVLGGSRSFTSPSVKITPPPPDRTSSPPDSAACGTPSTATPSTAVPKFRPQPLRFSAAVSQPLAGVAIDNGDANDNDDSSSTASSKSNSNSSPATPQSLSSNDIPLSPREEATKKLYEGLGIGRPASAVGNPTVTVSEHVDGEQHLSYQPQISVLVPTRIVSQPLRQPRGPPSGMDELGPKNFATRIRRKAIGGLGALMGARERREFIEAY